MDREFINYSKKLIEEVFNEEGIDKIKLGQYIKQDSEVNIEEVYYFNPFFKHKDIYYFTLLTDNKKISGYLSTKFYSNYCTNNSSCIFDTPDLFTNITKKRLMLRFIPFLEKYNKEIEKIIKYYGNQQIQYKRSDLNFINIIIEDKIETIYSSLLNSTKNFQLECFNQDKYIELCDSFKMELN